MFCGNEALCRLAHESGMNQEWVVVNEMVFCSNHLLRHDNLASSLCPLGEMMEKRKSGDALKVSGGKEELSDDSCTIEDRGDYAVYNELSGLGEAPMPKLP